MNQDILEFTTTCPVCDQNNWVDLLPWAEFAINSLKNESTQESPFFINFGFHPSSLQLLPSPSGIPAADSHVANLQESWKRILKTLQTAVAKQKTKADRHRQMGPSFKPGDLVWLSSKNISLKTPSPKLSPRFLGPFKILEKINSVAYRLDLPPTMKVPSMFHVSLLKAFVPSPHFPVPSRKPNPVSTLGQQEYEVQSLIDSRWSKNKLQFLVHWKGYGPEESSWSDSGSASSSCRILDVIDGYERRVSLLQKELRKHQASDVPVRDRKQSQESLDLDTTPNYKALLKSYQEQVREAKEKIEQLVRENADIREELASRPTCMELKLCVQQVRRLERIVLQNNLRDHAVLPRERSVETPGDAPSASASATVQDIDHLPAAVCRGYLQNLCRELGVQDVAGLVPAASAKAKQAETCAKLHKILSGIRSLLSGPRSPQLLYKPSNRLRESQNTGAGDESDFLHLLPTVEMWAGQLLSLRALHRSLRKLCEKLLPHRQTHETHGDSDNVRVEELLLLVDTMMEDVESEGKDAGRPSPHTLHALVSHFQTLFDVASVSGVFPRMNEVYSRLGEMSNAMRNQRCLLGLDDAATPGTLVNAVGRLCGEVEEGTSRQIQQLLGTLDIDSVINKLQEHDEFFPAFDGLIRALLEVLEIARLEEILPAVRRLKAPAAS
ncbi:centrosomal protein of 70 kDa [Ascaphus truei]|uniref:centrosomal protein of 70 kDa n=1 Tax=Ascaphus truei TaxID=8439 RepID=UPI003F5A9089